MPALPRLVLRVALAWLLACAAAMLGGRALVDALLPLLGMVSESLSSEFSATLTWDAKEPSMLLLRAQLLTPTAPTAALGLRGGQVIETGTNLEHLLVPPVVLLSVALGWPVAPFKRQLVLLALALPAAILSILLTTPFLLVGKIEALLQERAAGLGVARDDSLVAHWMIFTEGGGRWLLALLLALSCVALAQALTATRPAPARRPPTWEEFRRRIE